MHAGGADTHNLAAVMIMCYRRFPLLLIPCIVLTAEMPCASAEDSAAGAPKIEDPSGVVDVVSLDESALTESSGLAISRRRQNHFWSHNDSGGEERLYAFDSRGRATGRARLMSAKLVDWEDMASFTEDGIARLLVADCGDNNAQRQFITLYLFDEPDPKESTVVDSTQTIVVTYPDGPRDCEAVAVDTHRAQIVLIAKTAWPVCRVYSIPLPGRLARPTHSSVTAKQLGTVPLPMATGMDIEQSSGDIWLVSYFQAFRFRSEDRDESIAGQLARLPQAYELPRWKQIESIAVDETGDAWLTSEGAPAPLGRLLQERSPAHKTSTSP